MEVPRDGTAEGTVIIEDIDLGPDSSKISNHGFLSTGTAVFFHAIDETDGDPALDHRRNRRWDCWLDPLALTSRSRCRFLRNLWKRRCLFQCERRTPRIRALDQRCDNGRYQSDFRRARDRSLEPLRAVLVGKPAFFVATSGVLFPGAVDDRLHSGGDVVAQGHQPGRRFVRLRIRDFRGDSSSTAMTVPTGASCG